LFLWTIGSLCTEKKKKKVGKSLDLESDCSCHAYVAGLCTPLWVCQPTAKYYIVPYTSNSWTFWYLVTTLKAIMLRWCCTGVDRACIESLWNSNFLNPWNSNFLNPWNSNFLKWWGRRNPCSGLSHGESTYRSGLSEAKTICRQGANFKSVD
jgi:hypothetical protein